MSSHLRYTSEDIVTLINNGTDAAIDLRPALEDAFERRVNIATAQVSSFLNIGTMSLRFEDDKLRIKTGIQQHGLYPKNTSDIMPEVEMVFDIAEDGSYSLNKMHLQELWSGDTGYIKGWMALSECDPNTGTYKANVVNLAEKAGFVDLTNKLEEQNAQERRDIYAREEAIAQRIEAAQRPEDIADIIEKHAERLKVKHEGEEALEALRQMGDADSQSLVKAFDDLEQSSKSLGLTDDLAVSKILTRAKDAEGFQIAAAVYRNHYVHKADKDAQAVERSIPDRFRQLHNPQKGRMIQFGEYFEGNPHGAVVKYLSEAGNTMSQNLATVLNHTMRHIGDLGRYWVAKSDGFEDGLKAIEGTKALMSVFGDAVEKGELVDVLSYATTPEAPADALNDILSRIDMMSPKGTILHRELGVMADRAEQARMDQFAAIDSPD